MAEELWAEQEARRIEVREMLTSTAGFPVAKTLEAYDFAFATGAPKAQIQGLPRSASSSAQIISSAADTDGRARRHSGRRRYRSLTASGSPAGLLRSSQLRRGLKIMPDLFSPLTLKSVTVRNRIAMSPMTMYR